MKKANQSFELAFFLVIFLAIIADSALLPYYPILFEEFLEIQNSSYVGLYMAMLSIVAMLAMPLWVWLSNKFYYLNLLIIAQISAGVFAILCVSFSSRLYFFIFSLLMIACKASYLLIYPFVLEQQKKSHLKTIQIFTVLINLGFVLGAIMGGGILDYFLAQEIFYVIGIIDFSQAAICLALYLNLPKTKTFSKNSSTAYQRVEKHKEEGLTKDFIAVILAIFLFYSGSFVTRPFFVDYLSSSSFSYDASISGMIYSIPFVMAIVAICLSDNNSLRKWKSVPMSLLILALTSLLQILPSSILIIICRVLFGWALFQVSVALDWLAYAKRDSQDKKTTYMMINYSQNFGVIVAYYFAGASAQKYGLETPLLLGAMFFLVLFFIFITKRNLYVFNNQ
ncbi:hypothetical protein AAEX37_02478 [Oligella sp. MSHR50489EDL]|uniref:MFS transporter n=1 Tax=Oligella sp. MSHR50489EDL TaxID=3139409 RepID=UPI003D813475